MHIYIYKTTKVAKENPEGQGDENIRGNET